jgi:hypothetical protein
VWYRWLIRQSGSERWSNMQALLACIRADLGLRRNVGGRCAGAYAFTNAGLATVERHSVSRRSETTWWKITKSHRCLCIPRKPQGLPSNNGTGQSDDHKLRSDRGVRKVNRCLAALTARSNAANLWYKLIIMLVHYPSPFPAGSALSVPDFYTAQQSGVVC